MKVTTQIDITAEEYFKHLYKRSIEDIKKSTGKEVKLKDLIDGYDYVKKINYKKKEAYINMHVGPLIENKYFEVRYETQDTKCMYYYDFSNKDGINYVTYFEDNNYKEDTLGNRLGELRRKFRQKVLEKRILDNIELTTTYIKNHKEEQ